MKRLILIMAACLPVMGLLAAEVEPISADTIITLEKKRIEVKDNGDRMKVRVYELDEMVKRLMMKWFLKGTTVTGKVTNVANISRR